ncbi:Low conductance mechanosensitive channel YnaI [Calycomorphotria hydatis]|uniref:Low conductance mechanosensitive channel YnaI n=1 Tax=Calycomorphotria hydatis TaxID=2528027 RepID=A0A517TDF5_9PLAN|nr:Low conductance mechanosensitive channel YnaI [Calycomorphotria hydatis]
MLSSCCVVIGVTAVTNTQLLAQDIHIDDAKEHAAIQEVIEDWQPLEPADTSSPRATAMSFKTDCEEAYKLATKGGRSKQTEETAAAAKVYVKRFLSCMDLSQTPEFMRIDTGIEATVCIKEVLDRVGWPAPEVIPDLAEMDRRIDEGQLPIWRFPNCEIAIARMDDGPHKGQYIFTAHTVASAKEYFDIVEQLPYKHHETEDFYEWYRSAPGAVWLDRLVRSLPSWARNRIWGQSVWQWTGICITLILATCAMAVAYLVGRIRAGEFRGASSVRYLITLQFPIMAMCVPLVAEWFLSDILVIGGPVRSVLKFACDFAFLIAMLVVIISVGNRIAELLIMSPSIHPRGIDAQFIRFGMRILSLFAATVVFLEGGKRLGIPLTTLLAGAGVGGLAVALAAQDTLKNLFGSMMIVLDKPYRVGERILVKKYDGVVEDIGLRSTRIRALNGHVVTIPNEEMARCDIENVGRRQHIRRIQDIAIPFDTKPAKVEEAINIVREALNDHEGMNAEFPPRVFQNEFNRDSYNIRMIYWYHPPDYWAFLAHSEKLNGEIARNFEEAGIRFALPATENYLTRATIPPDAEHRDNGAGEPNFVPVPEGE